jgi:predicted DNA binding CopG/RHH family protein
MEKAMKKSRPPRTDSIPELAEFWDTHDLTDFEDELEEVTEPVFARGTAVRVYLQSKEVKAVRKLAEAKGVSGEELIQQWVRQRLARPNGRTPSRSPTPKPAGRRSKK